MTSTFFIEGGSRRSLRAYRPDLWFFYNLTHHSITIKPYHLRFKEGWPKSSWRASYLDLWVDLLRLSSHTGHPIVSPLFFFFTFFSHFYQIQYEAYLSIVDFFHFILSSMVVKAAIKRLGEYTNFWRRYFESRGSSVVIWDAATRNVNSGCLKLLYLCILAARAKLKLRR